MRRGTAISLALVLTTGLLAGCGVKSTPRDPEGATYPKVYPKALPPLERKSTEARRRTGPASSPENFYQYPNTPR